MSIEKIVSRLSVTAATPKSLQAVKGAADKHLKKYQPAVKFSDGQIRVKLASPVGKVTYTVKGSFGEVSVSLDDLASGPSLQSLTEFIDDGLLYPGSFDKGANGVAKALAASKASTKKAASLIAEYESFNEGVAGFLTELTSADLSDLTS